MIVVLAGYKFHELSGLGIHLYVCFVCYVYKNKYCDFFFYHSLQ